MGFRENLRESIGFIDIEQKKLAQKANVSLPSIENYLREKKPSIPTAEKAVRIAQVLGVTVEYLVTGKNSPDKPFASITPEIWQLIRSIESLPPTKQRIVIKNALNLADSLKNSKY